MNQDAWKFSLEFDIDKYGLITNPGKFERQTRLAPYLYLCSLEQGWDDLQTDDPYQPDLYVFNLSEEERREFVNPDQYPDGIEHALMWEDDRGHVTADLVEQGWYDTVLG